MITKEQIDAYKEINNAFSNEADKLLVEYRQLWINILGDKGIRLTVRRTIHHPPHECLHFLCLNKENIHYEGYEYANYSYSGSVHHSFILPNRWLYENWIEEATNIFNEKKLLAR